MSLFLLIIFLLALLIGMPVAVSLGLSAALVIVS